MPRYLLPLVLAAALLAVGLWLLRRGAHRQTAAERDVEGAPVSAPAPRRPPALDENALLRAKVAELTAEIEKVKAAQTKEAAEKKRDCLTTASDDCPFLDLSADELKEMARCGTVHLDQPNLDEGPDDVASLSPEQQRMESARVAVGERVRSQLQALYREADLPAPVPGTVQDLSRAIETALRRLDRTDVLRQIARERAGAAPPSEAEQQSLAQRYWRLRADVGDWYEGALAKHLGAERAHALRVEHNGWSFRAIHTGQCEDAGAR